MRTLLDLIPQLQGRAGEAVRFDDGFRTRILSYPDLWRRIASFAWHLRERGIRRGDRLLLWGENEPEWIVAFWSCVSQGVQVVPVDPSSSPALVERIQDKVQARLLVHGREVHPETGVERLSFRDLAALKTQSETLPQVRLEPDDPVEIVFTSGTTGSPKGVIHRHRNICANLTPFAREIARYRKYARPFQPVRFLNLLPLSHMFGQSAGLFIPLILGGGVVFMSELHPGAILDCIRRHRVSVLVSVPRVLTSLERRLRRGVEIPWGPVKRRGLPGVAARWWKYRQVHRTLGWKFWAIVVGGARLELRQEEWWAELGYALLQGYGLTETSPVVAVNHPFRPQRGALGRPLAGQEVRLAPDGEILVRGESVATQYLTSRSETTDILDQGWFRTGDVGELDETGVLYYKGRKKDLIVTADGLNVHPQDVESVLNRLPGIRDSVVVPTPSSVGDVVHAALIPADGKVDLAEMVRLANQRLEIHQRVRSWSVWPEGDFPRTPSTWKVRRHQVARRVAEGRGTLRRESVSPARAVLAQITGLDPRQIRGDQRLDVDLGLSSLDRVDLLSRLEDRRELELDEEGLARISTVQKLEAALTGSTPAGQHAAETGEERRPDTSMARDRVETPLPYWTRRTPVRWARTGLREGFMLPLLRNRLPLTVTGADLLKRLRPPVIFAANHVSHLDTPVILAALPPSWRRRLVPAMVQEWFLPHFRPGGFSWRERLSASLQYVLACGCFNAYPLPQRMGGIRRSLRYTGELLDHGFCPLVFPEGRRSPDGALASFQAGIGLMGVRLKVPVVPVYVEGLFKVFPAGSRWPRRGPVSVTFGRPVRLDPGQGYAEGAEEVRGAVQKLIPQGAAAFLSPIRGGKGGRQVPPPQSGAGDKKVAPPRRP